MKLARVLLQLGELLDEETAALKAGQHGVLPDLNYRKSHIFLELTRLLPGGAAELSREPSARHVLEDLKPKLGANEKMLKLHLEAITEVTTILASAIREAESDGTYSAGYAMLGSSR